MGLCNQGDGSQDLVYTVQDCFLVFYSFEKVHYTRNEKGKKLKLGK